MNTCASHARVQGPSLFLALLRSLGLRTTGTGILNQAILPSMRHSKGQDQNQEISTYCKEEMHRDDFNRSV